MGANGPTKAQASGPNWRRTTKGLYVPARVTDNVPEQRILEQSMRLPAGGAVTGWAACRLLGANFFDGLDVDGLTRFPVPLCIGGLGQLTETANSCIRRDSLDASEITRRAGVPCTTVLRALFDAVRFALGVREAVVAIDIMAAAGLASIRQLAEYIRSRGGWRGVPQVRAAIALASEHSRSPNETRMRLIWQLDAGLPRPRMNQPVFNLHGKLLGIADLLDPVGGVVGEYDGADHRSGTRQSKDVAREDGFRGVALEFFKVTGPDMRRRRMVANRMTTTRERAKWLVVGERSWTIEPPPSWKVEMSLDEQLELRAWQVALYRQHEQEGPHHLPNVS